jgi:hypothetical protein
MKISKIHKMFSDHLGEPKVLTNPEDYLGPNWKDVINFWLYVVTLNEEEIDKIGKSYWTLDDDVRESAIDASSVAAKEVVGLKVRDVAWSAAWDVTDWGSVFAYATCELIASHKLLEHGKSPTFLPLCLKS